VCVNQHVGRADAIRLELRHDRAARPVARELGDQGGAGAQTGGRGQGVGAVAAALGLCGAKEVGKEKDDDEGMEERDEENPLFSLLPLTSSRSVRSLSSGLGKAATAAR
jgi:hypothetical protein